MASAGRGAVSYQVSPEHASALVQACDQVPGSIAHRPLPTYSCLLLEERKFTFFCFNSKGASTVIIFFVPADLYL